MEKPIITINDEIEIFEFEFYPEIQYYQEPQYYVDEAGEVHELYTRS